MLLLRELLMESHQIMYHIKCPCCEKMVDNIEPAKMIYVELRVLTYAIKAELSVPICIDCFAELMFIYGNEMCSKEFKEITYNV